MEVIRRLANLDDAARLFEVRRKSILDLAPEGMSVAEAETWAAKLTLSGMERKLREFEIWVVELDGVVAGWGAIRGDYLEGLYTIPEFSCRGVGTDLLKLLEGLMLERGVHTVRAEASVNAEEFYVRRGYRRTAPQTPDGAIPIIKQLS